MYGDMRSYCNLNLAGTASNGQRDQCCGSGVTCTPAECVLQTSTAAAGTAATTCTACPPGQIDEDSNPTTGCTPCQPGGYCPGGGTGPTLCPAGRFRDDTFASALSDCAWCPAGYYSNTGASEGASACTICAAGQFDHDASAGDGVSSRTPCVAVPAGSYGVGGTARAYCPAGSYRATPGAAAHTDCAACAAGSEAATSAVRPRGGLFYLPFDSDVKLDPAAAAPRFHEDFNGGGGYQWYETLYAGVRQTTLVDSDDGKKYLAGRKFCEEVKAAHGTGMQTSGSIGFSSNAISGAEFSLAVMTVTARAQTPKAHNSGFGFQASGVSFPYVYTRMDNCCGGGVPAQWNFDKRALDGTEEVLTLEGAPFDAWVTFDTVMDFDNKARHDSAEDFSRLNALLSQLRPGFSFPRIALPFLDRLPSCGTRTKRRTARSSASRRPTW